MGSESDTHYDELERRLNQQAVLANFGVEALRSREITDVLDAAARLCAEGMQTSLCKVLKYRHESEDFLVIAGVGWHEGVVGHATIGAEMQSPAGYAMKTGKPVISNHLQAETRFKTPQLMVDHGVKRAVNVLILVSDKNFGVLEVDSRDEGEFGTADLSFLLGFANLIGVAIERQAAESKLQEAIAYQELLTREASHRVKNSLAMVSSLISMQSGRTANVEVKTALQNTQARILAIAHAHDQLWRHDQVGMVSLSSLLKSICKWLKGQNANVTLNLRCEDVDVKADRGIPMGLLVTELVTNALKYAYPGVEGTVDISTSVSDDSISITVADYGAGVPADWSFDSGRGKSLGGQLINSLTQQLGGKITIEATKGLTVNVTVPRE